jgi:hypothetical protein
MVILVRMGLFTSFVRQNNQCYYARLVNNRQLLAFSFTYSSISPTALIIPLPVVNEHRERAVDTLNLSAYRSIFFDLGRAFARTAFAPRAPKKVVPLEWVQPLSVTYLPDGYGFKNMARCCQLSIEFWNKLPQYGDHGYLVVTLPETGDVMKGVFPVAISFKSRLPEDALFFPTMQLTTCSLPQSATINAEIFYQGKKKLISDFTSTVDLDQSVNTRDSAQLVEHGKCHKRHIYGTMPNGDVIL